MREDVGPFEVRGASSYLFRSAGRLPLFSVKYVGDRAIKREERAAIVRAAFVARNTTDLFFVREKVSSKSSPNIVGVSVG